MAHTVLHTTAVVGDREALAGLQGGMHGHVHSAFRSVVNVNTGQQELLSLTSACVARGPRSIQLGLDRMDRHGIAPGDVVVSDGHTLRVGKNLVVIVAATPVWEDTPPVGELRADRVIRLGSMLKSRPATHQTPFEQAVTRRVDSSLAALRTALLAREDEAAHHAASSLVGLGVGLTPSGDDVLTGMAFVAARSSGALDAVHRAVTRIVGDGTTNDVSLTAMRCALRGRAVQPVEELYAWLCGADTQPHHLVADLLAIGHTSGADLALGLLTAVRLHLESQER